MEAFEQEDLRRWKAGDVLAFERVVLRHQGAVYHFALRMLGDADAAADVAQETFIRAYQAIQSFREGSALRTWLFSICRNLSLDELRRRQRRTDRERPYEPAVDAVSPWAVDRSACTEEKIEQRELGEALEAALATLPEEQRAVVVLKDRYGLSSEEIARVLDVPVGTVFSRAHRAYRKLAAALTSYAASHEEVIVQ